ncbi:hypothetical protein OG866_18530 [Streptomyces sp. NBC_00663]|uniref:hypothetical protein n=1 Tax=Streptomyces sp. NBC_00663 TaxID=2975801 RepID=UPI002E34BDE3|nr:hypothetical protein [Streptomyces sp. NBC_00663]
MGENGTEVAAGAEGAPLDSRVFEFAFQPGWVDLTREEGGWVEAWATATAVATTYFDPARLEVGTKALTRDLRRRALALNSGESNSAAAYYTPGGRAVAELRSDWYGEEGAPRPSPADVVPLLLDVADAEIIGEPDVRYMDLPYGSAARVQATYTERGRLGFGRRRGSFIKYALFPPGVHDLCVVWVSWWDERDADEVVRVVDELVTGRMRLVPADGDEGDGAGVQP